MARIIYAAAGDGFGHAVRAHAVGGGLMSRGHDVRFLSCHKTIQYLSQHFPDRLHDVFGLFTVYKDGHARPLPTLLSNARRALFEATPSYRAVERLFRNFQPDLVVTDFEPLSAIASLRLDVPFISLDNQHLLTHCDVEMPSGFKRDAFNAYLTIRLYYCRAQKYLIPTFIPARVRFEPAALLPPILRPQVYAREGRDDGFMLAYRSGEGNESSLRERLRALKNVEIRAYGFPQTGRQDHIQFCEMSTDGFLDDLASCRGVIASAGHSLISECLHFRKPMLLLPLKRHFEQALNAYHVERMGTGIAAQELTQRCFDEFRERSSSMIDAAAKIPRPELGKIVDAVEAELPENKMRSIEKPGNGARLEAA